VISACCATLIVSSKSAGQHVDRITRRKYDRAVPRYATNLSDAEWALIKPFMPVRKLLGRPREIDLRAVLDAIFSDLPLDPSTIFLSGFARDRGKTHRRFWSPRWFFGREGRTVIARLAGALDSGD
jgi:hypothetical protein